MGTSRDRWRALGCALVMLLVAGGLTWAAPAAGAAPTATVTLQLRIEMSDGVELEGRLSGAGPLVAGLVTLRARRRAPQP